MPTEVDLVDSSTDNITKIDISDNGSDNNDEAGLFISRTALIAIVSSLSILLFLIVLLLVISICLKMYRKKEESK